VSGPDSDIKTRITPLAELQLANRAGDDCLVVIYSSDARQFGKRYVLGREGQPVGVGRARSLVHGTPGLYEKCQPIVPTARPARHAPCRVQVAHQA
jgi:hypothetical protein